MNKKVVVESGIYACICIKSFFLKTCQALYYIVFEAKIHVHVSILHITINFSNLFVSGVMANVQHVSGLHYVSESKLD